MGSQFLKLLSRDMKAKTKIEYQPRSNNRKITEKAMGNITPAMDYYPRNGNIIDTDPIYNKP